MTATVEPIQTAAGIAYRVTRVFPNWASAQRGKAELDAINPAAYTPGLERGEPFDADETPRTVRWSDGKPPPCDGFNPIGHAYAGEALAQAQHEAATDGDDCTSGACLMVRGAGD